MKFSDGMEFDLSGPMRIEERSDGLYVVGNNSFGNPGNYTITLQSVNGCDSTILLDLIVTPLPPSPQLSFYVCKMPG